MIIYFKRPRFVFTQVTLVLSTLLLAAAMVSAYPQNPESRAVIVSQDTSISPDGSKKNEYVINHNFAV